MQNILILCHINLFPPTHTVNKALVNNTLDPSGIMWGINPFLNHHSVANIDSIGGCGNITCLYTPPLDSRTHTRTHTHACALTCTQPHYPSPPLLLIVFLFHRERFHTSPAAPRCLCLHPLLIVNLYSLKAQCEH